MKNVPFFESRTRYFQHDDAPTHTCAEISELFYRDFGNKWIGNSTYQVTGGITWFNSTEFFLFGFIKHKLYLNKINTEENFKSSQNRIKIDILCSTVVHNSVALTSWSVKCI